MPTYDYACASCDHHLEVRQRMTDEPLTQCPKCHEISLRKQLNGSGGFVLKGSGWYKDGYSSTKAREATPSCTTGTCPATEP